METESLDILDDKGDDKEDSANKSLNKKRQDHHQQQMDELRAWNED